MHPLAQFLIAANAMVQMAWAHRQQQRQAGPGLGATLSDLAQAIARFENTNPAANNPGAIWDSRTGSIRQYPTPDAGWRALASLTSRLVSMGLTPREFFGGKPGVYPGYAPAGHGANDPDNYAEVVSRWLGWDPDRPIRDQVGGYSQVSIPGGGTWSRYTPGAADPASLPVVASTTVYAGADQIGSGSGPTTPSWWGELGMPVQGSDLGPVSQANAGLLLGGAVLLSMILSRRV